MLTPHEPFDDVIREPFPGLMSLRDAVDQLFMESFIHPTSLEPLRRPFPLDVRETEKEYVIEAALPGIKAEDLQITATANTVTIRATHKSEEKSGENSEKEGHYVRRERYKDDMSRTIGLPIPVDPDEVAATYEHGVLTLMVPKTIKTGPIKVPVQIKDATEPVREH